MRALLMVFVLGSLLGGCATLPGTPRTPYLPPMVYGTYEDNDIGAINTAAWAFSSAANTRGNPIEAIRAVVALEYLSGQLVEDPRYVSMDSAVKMHMGQARNQLRTILGIPLDVPPQLVVNTLLALGLDLQTGNQPATLQVLHSPIFTFPPEQTLQTLSNLPYVQVANLATARAQAQTDVNRGPTL